MKGERIIAELLSLLGMVIYGIFLQHLYAELSNHPERSWINSGRSWWITRGSRRVEKEFRRTAKVLDLTRTAEEPKPHPADG